MLSFRRYKLQLLKKKVKGPLIYYRRGGDGSKFKKILDHVRVDLIPQGVHKKVHEIDVRNFS